MLARLKPYWPSLISALLLVLGLVLGRLSWASDQWLGSAQCKECHADAYQAWQGSHHDWAMKPAQPGFVLGDFEQARFEHFGVSTEFYRRGDQYFVKTENAKGQPQEFVVAYTFGFYPLQQYLLQLPKGRLQALTVAWDSRSKQEGGQRWFHLFPGEKIAAGDPLHWTGAYFNWNSRCAECHSTEVERQYNPATDSYQTQWAEINVGCEACHGPGQDHVQWARAGGQNPDKKIRALPATGRWQLAPGEWIAKRVQGPRQPGELSEQMNVCGSCHARRGLVQQKSYPKAGEDFLAQHIMQGIVEPLYHRDGQIKDEVFVLGSFMQSKMYQHGVQCSNCHEPHSLRLRAPGNGVCSQCHVPARYDQPEHHHHPVGSAGAQCVSCHMPATNYMVVDPRRDHSFRIPRPDLSAALGSPNACVQCHQERDNQWASQHFLQWLQQAGKPLPLKPALAETNPKKLLARINKETPIVAASILQRLAQQPSNQALLVAQSRLHHREAIVREAAVNFMAALPLPQRLQELLASLHEPVMAVRVAIARQTLGANLSRLDAQQREALEGIWRDYKNSLLFHQDTAAGQLNLGLYYLANKQIKSAEQSYRKALALEPLHLGAHLNLADLLRQRGDNAAALALLQSISQALPDAAAAQHALGLALVRDKQYPKAIAALAAAERLEPNNSRYAYVYAVALHSTGQSQKALGVLQQKAQQSQLDAQGQRFLAQLKQLKQRK